MAEREAGLWMSTKERDRLKVLHAVKKRHITQKQEGAELGLSERWIGHCCCGCEGGVMRGYGTGCAGDRRIAKRRRK